MNTFPGRFLKGAIVGIDPLNPIASIVIFQYNPEKLTRSLNAQTVGGESSSEPMRLKGAPTETITLDTEIDAADQLEKGDPTTISMGIYPQLSALEMLIYPKTPVVIANAALALAGSLELIAPEAPLTLLIWGPKRVLPVRLTQFTITEEAYDGQLNPIRAKVSLGLKVLSYNDLPPAHKGYGLFLAHQITKEAMAMIGSMNNLAAGLSL
ncbi:MAG: hypothetical protein FIB08_00895 [Candidatus Methanoperedens sp.]|nr:hypothetical protein [Candidatus Methanoperedens sp.]